MPPVTALRSPPASRITGADSPVMADSSTVAAPSMISPSAGITSPATTTTTSPLRRDSAGTAIEGAVGPALVGHGLGPGLAQGGRLGLAPAFGHGLGKVGEEHREPEPQGDLQEKKPGRRRARAYREAWPWSPPRPPWPRTSPGSSPSGGDRASGRNPRWPGSGSSYRTKNGLSLWQP